MRNPSPNHSADLLQDIEYDYQYEDASEAVRFANYILDLIFFFLAWLFIIVAIIVATSSFAIFEWFDNLPPGMEPLINLLSYGIYMSLVEGFSKGRSLGKLITGTRAIRWDNQPFSWSDALGRGFSRVVPFEPFSALWGNPWHDKWTDTRVVKNRR